jgi:hypothetical protein
MLALYSSSAVWNIKKNSPNGMLERLLADVIHVVVVIVATLLSMIRRRRGGSAARLQRRCRWHWKSHCRRGPTRRDALLGAFRVRHLVALVAAPPGG